MSSPEMEFDEIVFIFEWAPCVDFFVGVGGGLRALPIVAMVTGWGWTILAIFFRFTTTEIKHQKSIKYTCIISQLSIFLT